MESIADRSYYASQIQSTGREGGILPRTFAGVLSFWRCGIFALKPRRHMFEWNEFVPTGFCI